MSQTLEKRVETLEKKVARLLISGKGRTALRKKNSALTFGIFSNDLDFDEAARLGRSYSKQQTYQREIAGS